MTAAIIVFGVLLAVVLAGVALYWLVKIVDAIERAPTAADTVADIIEQLEGLNQTLANDPLLKAQRERSNQLLDAMATSWPPGRLQMEREELQASYIREMSRYDRVKMMPKGPFFIDPAQEQNKAD